MDIKQVADMLIEEGKKITYRNNMIKEYISYPSNYLQLEKKGEEWFLCEVIHERKTIPDVECLGKFSKESIASKYFLLNQLSSFYHLQYIFPSEDHTTFSKVREKNSIKDLEKSMNLIKIPSKYISYNKLQNNSIYMHKFDGGWHNSFIDSQGNLVATSAVPVSEGECIIRTFRKVYQLFLLDKFTEKNLQKGKMETEFNNNEKCYYLGYHTLQKSILLS